MLQNKWLLAVVGLLAAVKFLFLPLQQLQQEQYQLLDSLTKRVQRSEALLSEQQALQQWASAQEHQLQQLLQPFNQVDNAAQYRLMLQQQLQQLASSYDVTITLFNWVSDTPLSVFNLHRGRVTLQLEGEAANIMQMHLQLEQRYPQFISKDLKANWRGELSNKSRIELQLLLEVDYLLAGAV